MSNEHYKMIPEKAFLGQIIDLAHHLNWRVAHFRPARSKCNVCNGRGCQKCKFTGVTWVTAVQADGAGYPDLTMVRGKRLIFAELKSAKGEPSEDQMIWLALLDHAGAEAYLWRPADIESIERILK